MSKRSSGPYAINTVLNEFYHLCVSNFNNIPIHVWRQKARINRRFYDILAVLSFLGLAYKSPTHIVVYWNWSVDYSFLLMQHSHSFQHYPEDEMFQDEACDSSDLRTGKDLAVEDYKHSTPVYDDVWDDTSVQFDSLNDWS